MSYTKVGSDTPYKSPKTLSTDLFAVQLEGRMREVTSKLVGKVLTFVEAISENEQVSKARKDSISDILYTLTGEMIAQVRYELEWLDRSIYKEDTLKDSYSGKKYDFDCASMVLEEYNNKNIVKPDLN